MKYYNFSSNLIWKVSNGYDDTEVKFSKQKWDWCYFCADDVWVEFFIPIKEYADMIQEKFECKPIEFPGNILELITPEYLS